jgi:Arylsulfatase A and related enzymes
MIAFWPEGIKNKGQFSDCMGHVMDFMPTFVELANATYPKTFNGHAITPYTGNSLVAALKGDNKQVHKQLFNEHYRARYVRDGEWKMVSLSNDTTWRLYRINEDETELNDVSAQNPEVVKRLSEQWRAWANTHQVFPKPVNRNRN